MTVTGPSEGATENAGNENTAVKNTAVKMRKTVCMKSHNNVNAAEYIVCSFMHKTRHILSRPINKHIYSPIRRMKVSKNRHITCQQTVIVSKCSYKIYIT